MTPSWVSALRPSAPQGSELLAHERNKSKIDVDGLAIFLYTKKKLESQERLLNILHHDKAFEKSGNYFDSRIERYKKSVARAKRLRQLQLEHNWSNEDLTVAIELIGEPTSYALHWSMFIPTIRDQGTPQQHEQFLKRAEDFDIIGCYAQTELGHGSNVRGLGTTATWDPSDKTFILHSPHLTASKWWIGTLGRTANFAVVMAQLYISGKNYGPHPFLCQVRDLTTHQPLDGIYVGDIGPKLGYNTMDNGFLLFNNVKIPHINMLARYARVDLGSNSYVEPVSPALVYGTLTMIRSSIVLDSGRALSRGTAVAIRYCAVRQQFYDRDSPIKSGEMQVLDYSMVQIRLLPLIASSFALHFTGKTMMALYYDAQSSLPGQGSEERTQQGKDMFADLHATSCGLKALASSTAAEGLEVCRRACGGHAYSSFSGIGPWYADYVPTTTWEGDNYMLTQQVASYLLKSARAVLQGKAADNITTANLLNFQRRRHMLISFDLDQAEDIVAVFAVKSFYEEVKSSRAKTELNKESQQVLRKLFRLYALHTIGQEAHEFYTSSALTVAQVEKASKETLMKLLEDIRPHAVSLVDAWKLPDWLLNSSLGRQDGKVYEDLFYRASQLNPLNGLTVDPRPHSTVVIRKDLSAGPKSLM